MEANALSGIEWEKCNEIIQADSIQAIETAAIAWNVAYIEAVPCCPQTIDSILPSIPDTPTISKAITRSSGQSHLTCPESESSVSEMVSNPDDSHHPVIATDCQLNPKCMTEDD